MEDEKISVEEISKDWAGSVFLIFTKPGAGESSKPIRRAGVFVFDLPGGGFSWVEPHAWDPDGASAPARHDRPGAKVTLISAGKPAVGFLYDDDDTGETGMVYPWRPEDWPAVPELEAFYAQVERDGLDLKAERDRVRPALSGGGGA